MKENKTEIVKIQLDDGSEAYAELKREGFVQMGFTEKSYKVSSDYINIASNIINNLKSIDLKPEEIELEFGVKLEMVGGKVIIMDCNRYRCWGKYQCKGKMEDEVEKYY